MVRWLCSIRKALGLISRKTENKQIHGGCGSAYWTRAARETEAKGSLEPRLLRLGGQYNKAREKKKRETHR